MQSAEKERDEKAIRMDSISVLLFLACFFSCWCPFLASSTFTLLLPLYLLFVFLLPCNPVFYLFTLLSFPSLLKRKFPLLGRGKEQDWGRACSKNNGIGDILVVSLSWLILPSVYPESDYLPPPLPLTTATAIVYVTHHPLLPKLWHPNWSLSFHFCLYTVNMSTRMTLLKVKLLLCSQSFNGFRINSKFLTVDYEALNNVTPCYFPSLSSFHPSPCSLHSSHTAPLAGQPLAPSQLLIPLPEPLFPREPKSLPRHFL